MNLYAKTDRKRLVKEPHREFEGRGYRSQFRKDYSRLVHCSAFRRLQGKTQLYPSSENDFYRNRLTHSLEVAQVATTIARLLNKRDKFFRKQPINEDIIAFAALAHDIGHPPFGHNGEYALDRRMNNAGGFEGNAQTLRVISRIEKKVAKNYIGYSERLPVPFSTKAGMFHGDLRRGLNPSLRAIASVIKYDRQIPPSKKARNQNGGTQKPFKGYYNTESEIVSVIRDRLNVEEGKLYTLECSIMDVADDIAYSTYDLEDSLKGEFLNPLGIIAIDDNIKQQIAEEIESGLNDKIYKDLKKREKSFSVGDLNEVLLDLFQNVFRLDDDEYDELFEDNEIDEDGTVNIDLFNASVKLSSASQGASRQYCVDGYSRTGLTSDFVGRFVESVEVIYNEEQPFLSYARLKRDAFVSVTALKLICAKNLITSPMLKITEDRGALMINHIFDSVMNDGSSLLPKDWQVSFNAFEDDGWHSRIVCDFIASMTDRYCVEFYRRLTGLEPVSIHKPY